MLRHTSHSENEPLWILSGENAIIGYSEENSSKKHKLPKSKVTFFEKNKKVKSFYKQLNVKCFNWMWYFHSCQKSKCQQAKRLNMAWYYCCPVAICSWNMTFLGLAEKTGLRDSFWVWERLVCITQTNLRWHRFGGDAKTVSINLCTALRQQ